MRSRHKVTAFHAAVPELACSDPKGTNIPEVLELACVFVAASLPRTTRLASARRLPAFSIAEGVPPVRKETQLNGIAIEMVSCTVYDISHFMRNMKDR